MNNSFEKLLTIPQAASLLGIKAHALRRAVNLGLVPHYTAFNQRKRVKPSEVLAAMAHHGENSSHG